MKLFAALVAAALTVGVAAPLGAAEIAPADVKIVDGEFKTSLTGVAGDPVKGADTFKNRRLGNCLACHVNADMSKELFQGNVGPEMNGVAGRYSEAQLRAIVVNSKAIFTEETMMPGFYTLDVGKNVAQNFVGKTILSAQEVEDVVAYLLTLK